MTSLTKQPDRIEGKVAAILSRRELVINRGTEQGVEVGVQFAVLNSAGISIRDPDTQEVIDSIEVVKTVVKVVRVSTRTCVGRTFRTIPGTSGLAQALAAANSFAGSPSRTETLDIQSSSILKRELSEEDSYVKVGDIAVQVINDDFVDDLNTR